MDVPEHAASAAIRHVEGSVSVAEAAAAQLDPDSSESGRARAAAFVFAARAGVDVLASLGVLPSDRVEALRSRLSAIGLQTTHVTGTGSGASSIHRPTPSTTRQRLSKAPQAFEQDQHRRRSDWLDRARPPLGESPGVLPLQRLLGGSDTVAATLVELHAYTTGVQLQVLLHGRGNRPPFLPDTPTMAERLGVPVASRPQLEVTLAGGDTARTLGMHELADLLDLDRDLVTLVNFGGAGTNDRLQRSYFLSPFPDDGFTVRFSWAEHDLPVSDIAIDAAALATARQASTVIWP